MKESRSVSHEFWFRFNVRFHSDAFLISAGHRFRRPLVFALDSDPDVMNNPRVQSLPR